MLLLAVIARLDEVKSWQSTNFAIMDCFADKSARNDEFGCEFSVILQRIHKKFREFLVEFAKKFTEFTKNSRFKAKKR